MQGEDLLVRNQERTDSYHKKISFCKEEFGEANIKFQHQDLLEKLIEQETCKEILERMNERQKFVVLSYYVEGYSQKKIAEIMEMTQQAVAGLLDRTVQRIKKELKA